MITVEMTHGEYTLFKAGPLLHEVAATTLEMFERGGLANVSPEARAFVDVLKRTLAFVEVSNEKH